MICMVGIRETGGREHPPVQKFLRGPLVKPLMPDRPVDCMEDLVKYTIVMRPHFDLFGDRYSEPEQRRPKASQRPNEL